MPALEPPGESPIAGFVAVDKPVGITSHDVVAEVRRITGIKKAGHAGSLDPLATGLVVVGLGRATRLLRFLTDLEKEYVAEIQFGIATDTLDADGEETERRSMPFDVAALRAVLPDFTGDIWQVPPMVSALSVGGRRLHELAREGREVERAARPVVVRSLTIEGFAPSDFPTARLRVVCGKGTYVRVLADDLARRLGGRAHLIGLRRTRIGSLAPTSTFSDLNEAWRDLVITMSDGLTHLPLRVVGEDEAHYVRTGRRLPASVDGLERLVDDRGELLAVYRGAGGVGSPEVVVA